MYNTVKEMHIALDFGLQHVNSNRKQSIDGDHKDLALNYAVLQFIETRLSNKSNRKKEGSEESPKRYDDLKDLKRTYKSNTYRLSDKRVYSILPFDYYRYNSFAANVKFSKFSLPITNKEDNLTYHVLKFNDDNSEIAYKNLKVTHYSTTRFNIADYTNMPELYGADSKFMLINLMLEELNKIDGYTVYWENYHGQYYKDSFIITGITNYNWVLSYNNKSEVSKSITINRHCYNDLSGITRPVDIVSSEDDYNLSNNYYYEINGHRTPRCVVKQDIVEFIEGDKYVIPNMILEYYKKPRLINHRTNQSCEIQVNREIIDLAVQRLKAYIKDEGYQHIVNENQIIE